MGEVPEGLVRYILLKLLKLLTLVGEVPEGLSNNIETYEILRKLDA